MSHKPPSNHQQMVAAMSAPLPPFGIRGLCSPDKPFSVLQVSEKQYDTTIKSYSDAALTWLDEDDGETITVGAGWELRERLNDPVPSNAPLIRFRNHDTNRSEDRYVHLFDVANSHAGLHVWREHETYFSKSQKSFLERQNSSSVCAEKSDASSAECTTKPLGRSDNTANDGTMEPADKVENRTAILETNQVPAVSMAEALPELLDSLAALLQGTSDVLRKVAEKTRESNTSPIEDVLSGMTTILVEAGAFGLDMLESLNRSTIKDKEAELANEVTQSSPSFERKEPEVEVVEPSIDQDSQRPSFTKKGDVDMSTCVKDATLDNDDKVQESKPVTDTIQQYANQQRAELGAIPTEELHKLVQQRTSSTAYERFDPAHAEWRHLTTRQLKSELKMRPCLVRHANRLARAMKVNQPAPNSLLDQDAEDADFTARYPPLTTLRRANTIGGLRDGINTENASADFAFSPHVNRPSPQVFDAETQRRKDFARSCFPAQEYTPGLGPVTMNIEHKKLPALVKAPVYPSPAIGVPNSQSQLRDVEASMPEPSVECTIQKDEFHGESKQSPMERSEGAKKKAESNFAIEQGYKPLPGAWPDVVPERTPLLASPSSESSGAFFNRMMHDLGLQSSLNEDNIATSISRPTRHRSLADHRAKPNNSGNLHRSQTVSAINPAARLNQPFDSTFPIPPPDTKQETLSFHPGQSAPGPVRSLHRASSERRPRSLYEPYRPFSSHRSFSPVWEDHLKHTNSDSSTEVHRVNEARDPFSHPLDLVTIFAAGFSPGSTERDITTVIDEHCKDKWGRNCLRECRIQSTVPVVIVKLVLTDGIIADQLIAIFDKLTLGGRVLHFGKSRPVVHHAARESHRRNRHQDLPHRLSHMQSLPNFTASTRARVPQINIASRPRSIRNEPLVHPVSPPVPRPVISTRPPLHESIDACETKLRSMGYGADDPAMDSRLHVYAAAACGVVEEAIEMIEEDKDAHKAVANEHEEFDVMRAVQNSANDTAQGFSWN